MVIPHNRADDLPHPRLRYSPLQALCWRSRRSPSQKLWAQKQCQNRSALVGIVAAVCVEDTIITTLTQCSYDLPSLQPATVSCRKPSGIAERW